MRSRFTKTAVLICATLVTLNSVTAADEFKNSVVNMKIDKDGNNIKVTVVTDKPYTAPLVVNSKENNNYVILLPETKNVMKANPNIDKVSDTVNGFSIKTQPYNSGCYKGYTKILISTSKPTNISTTTKLNSQYKESTPTVKPTQELQKKVSKVLPAVVLKRPQKNYYQNYVLRRPNKHRRLFVVGKSKPVIAQHTYKPVVAKPIVKPQVKPIAVKPIVAKKVQNQVPKIAQTKPISKPITNKKQEAPLLVREQKAMDNEIKTRDEILKEIQKSDKTKQESNISIGEKIKSALSNLLHIKSGLIKSLLILSAVGFPIAVIFYIVLINKKLSSKSVRETQYYTKDIDDESSEDMQQNDDQIPTTPPTLPTPDNTEEEFDTEEPVELSQTYFPSDSQTDEITEEEIEESFKEFSNQEELEDDTNLLQEEKSILEEAETSFNAMLEDAETEDDLVEDTGHEEADTTDESEDEISIVEDEAIEPELEETLEEDIFANTESEEELETELEEDWDESIESPENDIEDIEISEDDELEEAGEELEVGEPSEIIEDLTDETPEELEGLKELEATQEPEYEQEEQESAEPIEIYEPDGFINDFEPIVPDDSVFDELIPQPLVFDETIEEEALALGDDDKDLEHDNDDIFEELREEYQIIDGMKVLTNAKIDESRGFYLVDYDNVSSLVGYVDDEIFVIKTFDDFVDNQIYIKLADKISETVNRYIVKVGLFKIVVEVTNAGMSHIIDL